MSDDLKQATQRKPGFLTTLKAVLWSFFGIRRSADHSSDMSKLNPLHVVIVGVLAAAGFVAILIFVVKMVVAK